MKLLNIINGLETGGAEKLIVDTVPLLAEQKIDVDILLLNGKRTPFYEELEKKQTTNIFSLGASYYSILNIFKIIPFLYKYDIVHVHLFPSQYFVVMAKILSGSNVKLIFTEHNTSNRRIQNRVLLPIEKRIYKYYDKIVCITEEVKSVLQKYLPLKEDKLSVINNGINLSEINNAKKYLKEDFKFKNSDILLIMVAGFREQKDQDTVIRTMSKLPREYKLILVGDGERRNIVQKIVNDSGLEDRVTFLGNRSDVYSLIKMADIAVLSSHWEGFGLASAEAMACGIPTIGSNVNGLAQVIDGGGLLFKKGDEDDLMQKILQLRDRETYEELSLKGLDKSKQFSIGFMIEKLIALYSSVYKE